MLNRRNTSLLSGCSTNKEQINPTAKPTHYLAKRMVLQDNSCRTQYACNKNEYA